MTTAERQALDVLAAALVRRSAAALDTQAQRLDRLALRLARPSDSLAGRRRVLDLLAQRLAAAPARALVAGRSRSDAAAARLRHSLAIARSRIAARVDSAAVRLEALDPDKVLARGYALLVDRDDRPVTSVSQLAVGVAVSARLSDGRAELATTAIEPAHAPR